MTADPAVETWRELGDAALLAVAADARCLLLALPHMPPSERAAMHEELAAAEPPDVASVLRAWRIVAGLHASVGTVSGPRNSAEALSGPQSACGGSALTGGGEAVARPLAATQDALPAVETPYRQVPAQPDSPCRTDTTRYGAIPVPVPIEPADPTALPRRFASLTPAQLDLARELTRRADKLWTDANGELSLAEAVTIAAVQMGHYQDADHA